MKFEPHFVSLSNSHQFHLALKFLIMLQKKINRENKIFQYRKVSNVYLKKRNVFRNNQFELREIDIFYLLQRNKSSHFFETEDAALKSLIYCLTFSC